MMPVNPALLSVLIYFHAVALGAILLSGFWSVMAEAFDPRSAKHVFGRISGAGTLGGIAGGVMAERAAAMFSPGSVVFLLAILHLLCCCVLASIRSLRLDNATVNRRKRSLPWSCSAVRVTSERRRSWY
jgi:hypothetical protein